MKFFALSNLRIYKLSKLRIFIIMTQQNEICSVDDFLTVVGRSEFQKETGKSVQLVQRAKDDDVFPDGWFWAVRDFCKKKSIKVPEHLFRNHPAKKSMPQEPAQ